MVGDDALGDARAVCFGVCAHTLTYDGVGIESYTFFGIENLWGLDAGKLKWNLIVRDSHGSFQKRQKISTLLNSYGGFCGRGSHDGHFETMDF